MYDLLMYDLLMYDLRLTTADFFKYYCILRPVLQMQ